MKLPLFPTDENLEGLWWHKLAHDASTVIFAFSIIISTLLFGYYLSKVHETNKIMNLTEEIELNLKN